MVNTLSTKTLRDKYRAAQVQQALKAAVVLEKVCIVDNTELRTISSPYITAVTTTVQTLTGTYTPAAITISTDTLTVTDEFICSTHIFDFEQSTAAFDLFFTANKAITNSIVTAVNKWGNKSTPHSKSSLIDLEAQKWATGRKAKATVNDLARRIQIMDMRKSALCYN